MSEYNNVPKIRFKGYTDAWEQRKASDLALFSKGNGYSKGDLVNEGTPIILYGRLYTKYQFMISDVDTFVVPQSGSIYSQGNEVIVPASGETAEDIARASAVEKSGILLGGDLNVLRPFNFINALFLALSISNGKPQKELAKKAQGKSVVHIHNSDIQEVLITYPLRVEQDKIGELFKNLDNLITLHQRKCETLVNVKKSLLEKMFPKNSSNIPEIRFKGFTDVWEQRKLANLINEYKETVTSDCTLPVLTSSKVDGVVLQEEHFGRKQNHDITGYNILPYGYCTYRNRSDGIDFTFNINKCCKMGIISKFYPVFYGNKNNINLISIILNNSKEVAREIGYTCSGTGQKVLSFLDLQKMNIIIPNRSEQNKISDLFDNLDNLITLHQRKLEKLKNIKKSMLDKMFV